MSDKLLIQALRALKAAHGQLVSVEWDGYDTSACERVCPCCAAWAYQNGETSAHGYACGLDVTIKEVAIVIDNISDALTALRAGQGRK